MSASPVEPDALSGPFKDGLVASTLGGLAMTARLLLSTEPVSAGWVIRRVLAAAITAAFVGYAIADHIQSPGLKMGAVGASGYAAPECLDYLMRAIKARAEKEVGSIERSVKPDAKKTPAKKRRRR